MKELEDAKCEVRRCTDLQLSIWDGCNPSAEEDGIPSPGSPGYDGASSAPLGKFLDDAAYAWLSNGPRLVVVNVKTGTSISSWTFRDNVTCVSPFAAQPGQVPLLLVGLDNGASRVKDSSGLVCVYDCTTSQVLRAIRMPAGVEQICVIMGGTESEDLGDKRVDDLIRENSGLACVALRNLDHLIVDLRRTSWEGPEATTVADESCPADLCFSERDETSSSRHKFAREKHAAYNLMNSRLEQYIGFNREEFESSSVCQESLTSSLICSRKIGCLISGCLGRVIIWQMDGAVRWVSPPTDESASVTHLALLEPTDDPRPFCYLWTSHHERNTRFPPVLRMYAMLFERKYTEKGTNVYLNLDNDPSLKFELELDDGNAITSLCPIIRESNPEQTESGNKRGEDSLLLITTNFRTLLFDLNQWYKEQMPHTIVDCQNPNVFIASYEHRRKNSKTNVEELTLDSYYATGSLKEFPFNGPSPADELFYPNSLSLEWIELGTGKLTFRMTRGLQSELLREMSIAGPVILIEPTVTFRRCLAAGLIAPTPEINSKTDKDVQRETILSLCLEQRWSQFLLKCAKDWSDGSASYLFHAFLRWGMQRASTLKLTAHRLCVPLYDQSGSSIGESEVKTLRFFGQQLDCISNVVTNLTIDDVDLTKQKRALKRVSTYLQVLLWFYDVGLLPETQDYDDEANLPIGFTLRIPYPFERLATLYRDKRRQFENNDVRKNVDTEKDLFIDELVARECGPLKPQWEREGGELNVDGNYPPSSLQSLLRSYLTDCHDSDSNEIDNKHQITIYLLMDLAMLLQGSCPGVDQLIKYPSAFKLSPSLIKLTQALWLLDHEDYNGFIDMMTGQLVSDCDVKDWHHKFVLRTLIRNNQNKLALIYLRVRKPPLSSLDDRETVISLSVEHGLVQSAFHRRSASHHARLLARFFKSCKIYGKLNDIMHLALDPDEEEAFVKFLETEKFDDTRLLYYLQRCRYAEAGNVYPSGILSGREHFSQKSKRPSSLTIFGAYSATLPNVTRKFFGAATRRTVDVDPESRYPRPMSHKKCRDKKGDVHDVVVKKAKETFLRGERTQIPFMSAPCSSLRSGIGNVATNCVLYVERVKKSRGKRTLDDMRDEAEATVDREDGTDAKRRKISPTMTTTKFERNGDETAEIGMSMVFDTPLVKRKNQMISARNTPIETPHSILKIRQMIRDSTSPGTTIVGPVAAETIDDRERKPRQIRFSIGQQLAETSTNDGTIDDETEEITAEREKDVAEESDETERSNGRGSFDNVREEIDEREDNEAFFSPNASDEATNETDKISIDGSYARRRNVSSGPRPRPGLRSKDNSIDDSSNDVRRKSIVKINDSEIERSPTATHWNSAKISDDVSTPSFDDKKFAIAKFSQSPKTGTSLLSNSVYSSSILTSDRSRDGMPVVKREIELSATTVETVDSFVERGTTEKCRDSDEISRNFEKSDNFDGFHRGGDGKSSGVTNYGDAYGGFVEEDGNSEVLMEVDGFGLDRDSETRSRGDLESNSDFGEKRRSSTLSTVRNVTMIEESPTEASKIVVEDGDAAEENDDEDERRKVEERSDDRSNERTATSKLPEIPETTESVEKSENLPSSDDCDEELMALRYEDDGDDDENEETFQSFSNSMEIDNQQNAKTNVPPTESITGDGVIDEKLKITPDECDITDDESSRSVGPSIIAESTNATDEILDRTISIDRIVYEKNLVDVGNITDDESNGARDSTLFYDEIRGIGLTKCSSTMEIERTSNETDVSRDSPIFSRRLRKNANSENASKSSKPDNDEIVRTSTRLTEDNASDNDNPVDSVPFESSETSPIKKIRQSSRLSKIGCGTPNESKISGDDRESTETTPLRVTRSRRASSVAAEIPPSPLTESSAKKLIAAKTGRLRRSTSLATEVFPTSDGTIGRTLSRETESPTRRSSIRRSVSLAKEIFGLKNLDESLKTDDSVPAIRRSSRKATSAQREIPESPKTPVKITRSVSKSSITDENTDEETSVGPKKTRIRKPASSAKDNDVVGTKRSTRGSSMIKEIPEENENDVAEVKGPKRTTRGSSLAKDIADDEVATEIGTKRTTRKRATSVPKDVEVGARNTSLRARRGGSAVKDVSPEVNNEIGERSRTKKISGSKLGSARPASPSSSIRSRLSSISSIPEEDDDEIFTASTTIAKPAGRKKATTARERRAVSVEPSQTEIKRRTRAGSMKRCMSENPIAEEEPCEPEVVTGGSRTRGTRKTTARRKRTVSVTSLNEDVDEEGSKEENNIFDKLPQRRTRKLSQMSNESVESYRFSPPDQALDKPDDDDRKEMGHVPDYVFSPPHTRSKHGTTIQPRK